MWLFTKYGFYSIVKKKYQEEDKPFPVRARKREDLENLLNHVSLEGGIINTTYADYYYRLVVDQEELGRIMSLLIENLDYDNFKDMIHHTDDQADKLDALLQVWKIMYNYQKQQS